MTALLPTAFEAVTVEYAAVAPMLIVVGAALVGVLVEAFAPRQLRHTIQVGLTLVALVAALVVLVLAVGCAGAVVLLQRQVAEQTEARALDVARVLAEDDAVRTAVATASAAPPADGATLATGPVQAAAEDARRRTGALFVVVTDDRGLRLTHPVADRLGRPVSTDPAAFGHPGSGGPLAFADPASGLAFAYVTNGRSPLHRDVRALGLIDAVRGCSDR